MSHRDLPDAGQLDHRAIDRRLPTDDEKRKLYTLATNAPIDITGDRQKPDEALADLLTDLATLGIVTDSSSSTPIEVTGARDVTEEALANLLTALATLGLITDSTTAS